MIANSRSLIYVQCISTLLYTRACAKSSEHGTLYTRQYMRGTPYRMSPVPALSVMPCMITLFISMKADHLAPYGYRARSAPRKVKSVQPFTCARSYRRALIFNMLTPPTFKLIMSMIAARTAARLVADWPPYSGFRALTCGVLPTRSRHFRALGSGAVSITCLKTACSTIFGLGAPLTTISSLVAIANTHFRGGAERFKGPYVRRRGPRGLEETC